MIPEVFENYQPQLTQIEVKFRGPLLKDSMVETPQDLTLIDTRYNYQNRLIWVNSTKSNYYLDNGNGSQLSNWKIHSNKTIVVPYEPFREYVIGEPVFQNGKIYIATDNVPIQTPPETNQNFWRIVISDTVTYRIIPEFINNQYLITVNIKNPIFEVYFCNIIMDGTNYVIGSDGLIKIENREIVEPIIILREDIASNKYEIKFLVNNEQYLPTQHDIDIIVNIK